MENEEVIYIDPEEEEVFFGNITEKEKSIISKLVACKGSPLAVKEDCGLYSGNVNISLKNEITDNNVQFMQKLLKAEGKVEDFTKEDEDKENRVIPEIRIINPTPKKYEITPPSKSIESKLRRFRIIYNSPENNASESCQNVKTKSVDSDYIPLEASNKTVELIKFENPTLEHPKENEPDLAVEKKEGDVERVEPLDESNDRKPDKNVSQENETKRPKTGNLPTPYRLSTDARKLVQMLKTAVTDSTLNTVPETDLDEVEISFESPEPFSCSDVADIKKPETPQPVTESTENKHVRLVKTVEKEMQKVTPIISQSKLQQFRCLTGGSVYNRTGSGNKVCAKKLNLEEKLGAEENKNCKGAKGLSKIPVFAAKGSKIPVPGKVTPMKTLSGSSCKNPKFKHIKSPVSSYIHDKPTSLLGSVKPKGIKTSQMSKTQPVTPRP